MAEPCTGLERPEELLAALGPLFAPGTERLFEKRLESLRRL